jgi:hypothetical protein
MVTFSKQLHCSSLKLAHALSSPPCWQIASVIGLPWPLANNFITLEGAALRYVPTDFQTPGGGPKLLAQFVVAASMDIPALHATKLNAAVVVSAGAGVAIQVG